MASTAEATLLTQTHRRAQVALGKQTEAGLREVWSTLDLQDLDGTFNTWCDLASRIVRRQRASSARLAANYYTTFRSLELGSDVRPIVPVLAEKVTAPQLATSLRVTGPVSLKSNVGKGMDLGRAADIANERSSRAGQRYALGGGRDTVVETVRTDPEAKGWVWVAEPGACAYCENLDGVLFYLGETEFNPHDGCGCGTEIAY